MIYDYRCRECRQEVIFSENKGPVPCPCGGTLRRNYKSVNINPAIFQGHFNHSVGKYVPTQRAFRDELKVASEAETLRTGIEHNYKPIDPRELSHHVDPEAIDAKRKNSIDKGIA